ncbi:jg23314 [Pararge aegeria aegeria]|uniref:Jg23314 protein n=1 Tax=Pararge aegeria aegeria TaxID=348720 RepID=A0A8S4R9C9_9NEOP|nr:jg23314 [Pararge aegeria aegeria]
MLLRGRNKHSCEGLDKQETQNATQTHMCGVCFKTELPIVWIIMLNNGRPLLDIGLLHEVQNTTVLCNLGPGALCDSLDAIRPPYPMRGRTLVVQH